MTRLLAAVHEVGAEGRLLAEAEDLGAESRLLTEDLGGWR